MTVADIARASQRFLVEWITLDVPKFIVVTTTLGYFSLLALLAFHQIPEGSKEVLMVQIGVVGTAWGGSIVNYFFGSSAGSAAKNALLKPEEKKDA